jgi:error-prone DNA polymerase
MPSPHLRHGLGGSVARGRPRGCAPPGLDLPIRTLRRSARSGNQITGFPRHLSQHVGGFRHHPRPLSEVVPIENAAMEDRTIVEWDKDDLESLGMLKIDVLALGMLTCIRRPSVCSTLHYGRRDDARLDARWRYPQSTT